MSNISTIRVKKASSEGWQKVKILRSEYHGGVLVDNGQRSMWVKLDQCHPEDVEYLATALDDNSHFGGKRVFLSVVVGVVTSLIFYLLILLPSGLSFWLLFFLSILPPGLAIFLLCAGGGGIIGGYVGVKYGYQEKGIYICRLSNRGNSIVVTSLPFVLGLFIRFRTPMVEEVGCY